MNDTILEDIKISNGVPVDNLGFDTELLIKINAVKAELVQMGVSEVDIDIVRESAWPVFRNNTLQDLVKLHLVLKTKVIFDPIANESINSTFQNHLTTLEGRIMHEVEEIENV